MDRLKFRAYCHKTKKIVYDGDRYNISDNQWVKYTCRITNIGIFWVQPYNRRVETVCECGNYSDWDKEMINSDCDLMQCTGLTDKNGKEIYEGDIFKRVYHPIGGHPDVYQYAHIGVIEFRYNSFGVVNKLKTGTQLKPEECLSHEKNYKEIYKHPTVGEDWFDDSVTFSQLEVIGNIHDNSELIEV